MGWSVGWEPKHGRFRGYGVPAYCDAKGCGVEIHRGLFYGVGAGSGEDVVPSVLFTCSEHGFGDVDEADLPPEHPAWKQHVQTDDSWAQWRSENPESELLR